MTRFVTPGPQHPFDRDDQTSAGACDLERYVQLHAEPEPELEHRYLWVLDVMAGCGIALILFYVAMRVAEGLV